MKIESTNRWFNDWEKKLADAASVMNNQHEEFDFASTWKEYVTPDYRQWLLEDSEDEEETRQDESAEGRSRGSSRAENPDDILPEIRDWDDNYTHDGGDAVSDGNFMALLNSMQQDVEDHSTAKGVSSRNFVFDASGVDHDEMSAFME